MTTTVQDVISSLKRENYTHRSTSIELGDGEVFTFDAILTGPDGGNNLVVVKKAETDELLQLGRIMDVFTRSLLLNHSCRRVTLMLVTAPSAAEAAKDISSFCRVVLVSERNFNEAIRDFFPLPPVLRPAEVPDSDHKLNDLIRGTSNGYNRESRDMFQLQSAQRVVESLVLAARTSEDDVRSVAISAVAASL